MDNWQRTIKYSSRIRQLQKAHVALRHAPSNGPCLNFFSHQWQKPN